MVKSKHCKKSAMSMCTLRCIIEQLNCLVMPKDYSLSVSFHIESSKAILFLARLILVPSERNITLNKKQYLNTGIYQWEFPPSVFPDQPCFPVILSIWSSTTGH